MRLRRIETVTFLVLLYMCSAAGKAMSDTREKNPVIWLNHNYNLYLRAETSKSVEKRIEIKLVEDRASKEFAALLKKDRNCSINESGLCALDWDFIIDCQDWQISKMKIGGLITTGDKAIVTVSFRIMGKDSRNIYYFVRENSEWIVDDVETRTGHDAPFISLSCSRISTIRNKY